MAQQPQTESRVARRPGLARPRRQRPHQPARCGRARRRRSRHPQEQGHDAGGLGRQREAPAGGQVELTRLAPGLDQRRAEGGAARRLGAGPQHALGVAGAHQQHPSRIESELEEARRMQPAGLGIEEILPGPEQRPRPCRPQRQGCGKAGRGGKVGPARRVNLVQGGAGDATAQRLVQRRHAEGDALHRRKLTREPRQGEALPETGQGAGGGIGHGFRVHYLFTCKTTPKPPPSQARICGMVLAHGARKPAMSSRLHGRPVAKRRGSVISRKRLSACYGHASPPVRHPQGPP